MPAILSSFGSLTDRKVHGFNVDGDSGKALHFATLSGLARLLTFLSPEGEPAGPRGSTKAGTLVRVGGWYGRGPSGEAHHVSAGRGSTSLSGRIFSLTASALLSFRGRSLLLVNMIGGYCCRSIELLFCCSCFSDPTIQCQWRKSD